MYCKFCGQQIEDDAAFCSKCGKSVNQAGETVQTEEPQPKSVKSKSKKSLFRRVLKALLVVVAVCAFLRSINPDNNILNIDTMREAYSYSQDVIRGEILTPQTAEFPKFEPEFVTQHYETITYEGIEYQVYTVTAYVDYENAFGTMIRLDYVVEIGFPSDSSVDSIFYNIVEF